MHKAPSFDYFEHYCTIVHQCQNWRTLVYIIHDSEQLIGPRPAQPTTATLLTPAATNLQLHPLQSFRLLGRGHHSHHGQQLRRVTVLGNVHSPAQTPAFAAPPRGSGNQYWKLLLFDYFWLSMANI